MAERRMFAKTIVLSDAFLDMPLSARCLYFTLGMLADDDGFVNSPKSIMRQCGASQDDMKILLAKKFLISFETGVIVIKHWKINNYLRSDRYKETKFIEEKKQLNIKENGAYSIIGIPPGIPRLGKDSIGKDSIGNTCAISCEIDTHEQEKKEENSFGIEEFLDLYHFKCPNLPKALKITEDRKRKIKARLLAYSSVEWWTTVFEKANKSNFCINGKWCNLDFFIANDTNPLKVIEGKYDNKGGENDARDKGLPEGCNKYDRKQGWF